MLDSDASGAHGGGDSVEIVAEKKAEEVVGRNSISGVTAIKKSSEESFVFQLPAATVCSLASILDPGSCWEEIAALMPEITAVDIEACRRLRSGESPTEGLLRIWGSLGYSVSDLYKVFFRLKLVRCMDCIEAYIDPRLCKLAKRYLEGKERDSLMLTAASTADSAKGGHLPSGSAATAQPTAAATSPPSSSQATSSQTAAAVAAQAACSNSSFASSPHPSPLVLQQQHHQRIVSYGTPPTSPQLSVSGERRKNREEENEEKEIMAGLQSTPSVRYEELVVATNNFAPERLLGHGGYGAVYRAEWKHTEVAVKRLQGGKRWRPTGDDCRASEAQRERVRQSLQELRTMAKYRHENILGLYAYSMDGPEPCLVYQYMPNGSLEERLMCKNFTSPIPWATRLDIARGAACGLHFLHSVSAAPIIHGDVKSANILLDRWYQPKLGDFGLSRVLHLTDVASEKEASSLYEYNETKSGEIASLSRSDSCRGRVEDADPIMIASHIKGTLAYLPPEFLSGRVLTTKLDVYSYGVVLYELATGQRAYSGQRAHAPGIVKFVEGELKKASDERGGGEAPHGQSFEKLESKENQRLVAAMLGDRRAAGVDNNDEEEFMSMACAELVWMGRQCTHCDRFQRPSFAEILAQLAIKARSQNK